MPVQRRLWNKTSLKGNIWNGPAKEYKEVGRASVQFAGTEEILTAMDELFGYDGTRDFLKDNLFEVKTTKLKVLQNLSLSDSGRVCFLDTHVVFAMNVIFIPTFIYSYCDI